MTAPLRAIGSKAFRNSLIFIRLVLVGLCGSAAIEHRSRVCGNKKPLAMVSRRAALLGSGNAVRRYNSAADLA
jgi:hypothetical protein